MCFIFHQEQEIKKTYNPWISTVARTITDEVHQKIYKEKKERKRAREKKQEIKLLQGNNKKTSRKKEKVKDLLTKQGKGKSKMRRTSFKRDPVNSLKINHKEFLM